MNNINLKNTIENLIDTFLEAGRVAKKISERGVKITIKTDKTPVTDGDLAVDEILRKKIEDLTPIIPIISEETVNLDIENKYKNFWLIDPIDGTRDYIKKKEEYTLNAALIVDLKPVAGIIYGENGSTLSDVYINAFNYTYDVTAQSNEDGAFFIELVNGTYDIEFWKMIFIR